MPFLFKSEIKESKIQGSGVHASEFIPKGAKVWQFEPTGIPCKGVETTLNRALTKEEMESMPEKQVTYTLHSGYYDTKNDVYVELNQAAAYVNHENKASMELILVQGNVRQGHAIALRDIQEGQQITGCYFDYPYEKDSWIGKLFDKYDPDRSTCLEESKKQLVD